MSPFRVALTGGIASGKSTVAGLFAARGVSVIDTDLIARQVIEPGEPALAAVIEAFGCGVLGPDGRLDRPRMRERVFADPAARRRLEAILHPAIRAEMERQARAAGGPYQLLVIPLLVEAGRRDHVDRVLVVDVPEATQIERLMRRDGVPRGQAEAALRAQATRDARLALADDVIENTDDLAALEAQVEALHRDYLRRAGV
jgi:dephospho-CoA kinase